MTEENTPMEDESKPESTRPPVRAFNPLVNYVFYSMAVLVAYVLFWALGYPAVIIMMLFFIIRLARDTIYVTRTYEYKFARQASVVNLIYSTFFFIVLVVNGIAISQQLAPLIVPGIVDVTSWTPLFILGGVFGMSNIKRMWGPRPTFKY